MERFDVPLRELRRRVRRKYVNTTLVQWTRASHGARGWLGPGGRGWRSRAGGLLRQWRGYFVQEVQHRRRIALRATRR